MGGRKKVLKEGKKDSVMRREKGRENL